jgi:Glycosyl transferases group 1/DUF based on E. rectale Gene description (DUF3880)
VTDGSNTLLSLLGEAHDALEAQRAPAADLDPEGLPHDDAATTTAAPRRPELRVASLMDEFTTMAFDPEIALNQFGPDDWPERVAADPPALLLVESAWRGNDGRWRTRLSSAKGVDPDLVALVDWCRRSDIPTVFWNKEDPANFEVFKYTATLFDHILTTDADCIPRYRALTGHNRVSVLPFAAQPAIHNPIAVGAGRERHVAFAGTYYVHKHPDRRVQMEAILDPAREFGLEIFSRVPESEHFAYPEKYKPHIVGSLPYSKLLLAHKLYKVFLNVNSVVQSRTMCARRIFELLASGTGVVSGASPAIASLLGPGLVPESEHAGTTREHLAELLGDDDARERRAVRGLRTVLRNHTYAHRVAAICRAVGLDPGPPPPSAAVLACPRNRQEAERVLAAVERQRRQPEQVVLVCPHGVADGLWCPAPLRVIEVAADATEGARMRRGLEAVWTEFVAPLDPASAYGEHYLGDSLMAFDYTDATIVGKRSRYGAERPGGRPMLFDAELEYRFTGRVDPATVVLRRAAIDPGDMPDGTNPLEHLQMRSYVRGARIFAADRFNYFGNAASAELPSLARA